MAEVVLYVSLVERNLPCAPSASLPSIRQS